MIEIEEMSILVVDDMKSMRLTIRKMLRNLNIGKMLRFAENGKEGLAVLKESPCDMAIIDWNMPVMNGTQMLDKLKQDKALRDMPVIMVTAENERDIVSEVAESEVDAYLLKPLTLGALDQKIRMVVENANNPDEAARAVLRARELEESGDVEGAIEQIRLALTFKPSASRILRKLGLLHFKIGKAAIGEKCLQKAISVNHQDTISLDHLGRLYMKKNDYKRAAQIYMKVMGLSTRYYATATDLGEKMLDKGYKAEALQLFSRVVSRSRRNAGLRSRIIDTCMANHEYEFVTNIMEQTLRDNPSNYDLLYKTGLVHQETGNLDRALECFRTVDSHRKGDINSKLQIARIYYINRQVIKADDYLTQVLRLDPGNEDALSLRQQL